MAVTFADAVDLALVANADCAPAMLPWYLLTDSGLIIAWVRSI